LDESELRWRELMLPKKRQPKPGEQPASPVPLFMQHRNATDLKPCSPRAGEPPSSSQQAPHSPGLLLQNPAPRIGAAQAAPVMASRWTSRRQSLSTLDAMTYCASPRSWAPEAASHHLASLSPTSPSAYSTGTPTGGSPRSPVSPFLNGLPIQGSRMPIGVSPAAAKREELGWKLSLLEADAILRDHGRVVANDGHPTKAPHSNPLPQRHRRASI